MGAAVSPGGAYELLGIPVSKTFKQKGSQPRTGASRNSVRHDESLQTVAALSLPIEHLHDIFVNALACCVPVRPVVSRSTAVFANVNVLGIIQVGIRPSANLVHHARLKINKDGAGDVVIIVGLVEKNVLAIVSVNSKTLKTAACVNAMLNAKLAPELAAHLVAALAHLKCDYLPWHSLGLWCFDQSWRQITVDNDFNQNNQNNLPDQSGQS